MRIGEDNLEEQGKAFSLFQDNSSQRERQQLNIILYSSRDQ